MRRNSIVAEENKAALDKFVARFLMNGNNDMVDSAGLQATKKRTRRKHGKHACSDDWRQLNGHWI